jgi:glycosyltransferase involved in cell wall biosynthesis
LEAIGSVVIVSPVDPYPPTTGKAVVLAGFVEYWRRRLGREAVSYLLVRHEAPDASRYPTPVRHLLPPRATERARALVVRTTTGRASIQEAMFHGRSLRRQLKRHLGELDPDLVLFDTVRMGQYDQELPRRPGQRRMVYLDDLMSVRYRSMLANRAVTFDALGTFSHLVPGPLRPIVRAGVPQRGLLRLEARLMERSERAATGRFDACLLVSEPEVAMLTLSTGQGNVRATPPLLLVDTGVPRAWSGDPEFVCLGNLVLPHNDDGVRWFLSEAMAAASRRLPGAHLRIVGRGARAELVDLVRRTQDVTLAGYVPDLDVELASAAVMLAPMRFGSGIKIKLLDALARGLPVLTTSVGAHGIAEGPHHGVVIEDDVRAWPDAMARMCEPENNKRLSARARRRFETTFAVEAVTARYDEVFS